VREALGDNVLVVGHSLGGGMAAAAAHATGWRAITFNAAGVHTNYREGTPGDIRAHYIVGEILTTLQDMTPLPAAVGTPIAHSASCIKGPVRRHLLAAYEESKARWQASEKEDEAAGTTGDVAAGAIDPASGLRIYVPPADRTTGRTAKASP
jgi:pimeloyl-ACP methyl ester carboxylesterase